MLNEKDPSSKKPVKKKGKGETISELAHRHLRDQNHTTSDEELRNATVELSDDADRPEGNLYEIDNTTVLPSEANDDDDNINDTRDNERKNKDDNDDNIPNPYKVLSS